jgi:hypothetical protein
LLVPKQYTKPVLVDAHVHVYGCFDTDNFLDQAYFNFKVAARRLGRSQFIGVLMLTETLNDHYFSSFAALADAGPEMKNTGNIGRWSFDKTKELCSLLATKNDVELFLIAGRQVVTAENLEVLILGTEKTFPDGMPIRTLLQKAASMDALHVIPWGAGKWLFRRGRLLSNLIAGRTTDGFYLGDQGGRPMFWPTPSHLRQAEEFGIRILPGTDPFPFSDEVGRVGSFGFLIDASLDPLNPAATLKESLRNPQVKLTRFGQLQNSPRFFQNQLRMQIRKRRRRQASLTSEIRE